ncbi:hypothetical protein, partial [Bradyrhizobium sp. SZCCHNR1047]|uniref:hypothetical protein n=1 Tax=Bradyrhizobium sp. SZCCHNR1047 TaxID=3057354 RepID=UPI00291625E5
MLTPRAATSVSPPRIDFAAASAAIIRDVSKGHARCRGAWRSATAPATIFTENEQPNAPVADKTPQHLNAEHASYLRRRRPDRILHSGDALLFGQHHAHYLIGTHRGRARSVWRSCRIEPFALRLDDRLHHGN